MPGARPSAGRQLSASASTEIRSIVQLGDQYRLISPQQNPFSAVQYVSKDKSEAVLFVFRLHIPEYARQVRLPPVYPRGLDPEAIYAIDGFDPTRSGKAWMEAGLHVPVANLQSRTLRIRRISG